MDTAHDYLILAEGQDDVFAADPAQVTGGYQYTRNIAKAKRFHSLREAEHEAAPSERIIPIDDLSVMFGGWLGMQHG